MFLHAPNIPFAHAFTTRHGGISAPPFNSLNVGGSDDVPGNISENRSRVLKALKLEACELSLLKQVHGETVRHAAPVRQEGDALVTSDKRFAIAVSVADCYPLLFADAKNSVIGVAHAGWRGTVRKIAGRVLEEMVKLGASLPEIRVAIGQGICRDRFEVGEEVTAQFREAGFPRELLQRSHIDLPACNEHTLLEGGVPRDNIWKMGRCTFEDDFFSYRRDKGATGRMWGILSLKALVIALLLSSVHCIAQQTIAYTQYTFNKAGMNPAASGTSINQKYYFAAGLRRQWTDFDNGPKQNFVNASYTLRQPRSYRYWQNFSFYADNDDAGVNGNTGAYAGYALHMLLTRKLVASFGVYAGVRRFERSLSGFDALDPAVHNNAAAILLYPDIIPGVRLSGKKFFAGASVRQITINKLRDFKKHSIGSPSKLTPVLYAEYGRKIEVSDRLLMMPSVAAHIPIVGIPVVDATLMYYFANRLGLGASVRNTSFASAILQIRFLENLTAGFSYSYPLNGMRVGSGHTYEFMIGMTPLGMDAKLEGKHSVAKCPSLSY